MAHQWADRVAETSTTTGTGALTLAGAVTGFQRFSAVCSVNDTVIYAIEAVDGSGVPTGDWEVGVGTYSATNTLTRTTVIKSSNSNAAVSFAAGTKNVFLDDIASTRNTLQQYSGTSEPSAPVEGLIHFAKDFNGWTQPYARGAANRSFALDPYMTGRVGCGRVLPTPASGTPQGLGVTLTVSGTTGVPSPGTTNVFSRFYRSTISTTATVSTAASLRDAQAGVFLRGTNANEGCRLCFRFGLEAVANTNCRYFVGLLSSPSAQAATFDPATAAQAQIGIGCTGTDTTNMKLYYNDTVGSPSTIDLGANYPAKTAQGAVVELILYAEPSATTVKYSVRRLDDLTIAPTTGALSTDLPAAGQYFSHFTINNNATAALSQLAFFGYFVETGI